MADVSKIDAIAANQVISIEEGHYADVKRIALKPAKLSETVSAFANTSGGEVFLGIAEDKAATPPRWWDGFSTLEDANAHIQVLEKLNALGNHYKAEFLTSDAYKGYVLHLTVPKTKGIILATDGFAYIRRNAQNLKVDTDEMKERLRLDKGVSSFEDQTVNAKVDIISESLVAIEFLLSVVPSANDPTTWLESQFVVDGNKPCVAGVMLFADEPQAALPKRSGIKILRYKSKEDEGSREALEFDPITIEGHIYSQINSAVTATKKLVEGLKKLGVGGLEEVVYPDETLHEVVTNAVLHRDYSIPADIQIRIYDNRIEVESPGVLPGHVTVGNILTQQSARNPKIVRLINKFPNPPNKDVGEGLNTAFAAMKALRLKQPEIEQRESSVIVYISHAPLSSPEDIVMEYLKTHSEITNSVGRDLAALRSENTMKEVFYRLAKRKLIERVPGKLGNLAAWRPHTGATATGDDDATTGGLFEE
jgi:ATP-dependent DNA helicase RecG